MSAGAMVVLQAALLVTGGESYSEAYKKTREKNCPLVVVVGATWCPACAHMKQDVLPEAKRRGIFRRVAYAEVDLDQQRELGAQLTDGGPIPQIVMYRKTPLGWRMERLIGGQDVRTIQEFVAQGVEAQEAETKAADSPGKKTKPDKPTKANRASTRESAVSRPTPTTN